MRSPLMVPVFVEKGESVALGERRHDLWLLALGRCESCDLPEVAFGAAGKEERQDAATLTNEGVAMSLAARQEDKSGGLGLEVLVTAIELEPSLEDEEPFIDVVVNVEGVAT